MKNSKFTEIKGNKDQVDLKKPVHGKSEFFVKTPEPKKVATNKTEPQKTEIQKPTETTRLLKK